MKNFKEYLDSILNEESESLKMANKMNLEYRGNGVYKDKQ